MDISKNTAFKRVRENINFIKTLNAYIISQMEDDVTCDTEELNHLFYFLNSQISSDIRYLKYTYGVTDQYLKGKEFYDVTGEFHKLIDTYNCYDYRKRLKEYEEYEERINNDSYASRFVQSYE